MPIRATLKLVLDDAPLIAALNEQLKPLEKLLGEEIKRISLPDGELRVSIETASGKTMDAILSLGVDLPLPQGS